jgi:hypothetical protein
LNNWRNVDTVGRTIVLWCSHDENQLEEKRLPLMQFMGLVVR